jgi:hypothetical protein
MRDPSIRAYEACELFAVPGAVQCHGLKASLILTLPPAT